MCWVPLINKPIKLITNTLILDHPHKLESFNSMYSVFNTTTATPQWIQALMEDASSSLSAIEVIKNVYKLPRVKQSILYLHAAAGHPNLPTWLKAISQENYNSWLFSRRLQCKKKIPKLEETQLGHRRGAWKQVCSMRQCPPANPYPPQVLNTSG